MRIFQLIEFSTNPSVPNNQTWYRNLYEPLIDLGHDVILVSADAGRKALFEKNEKLRKEFSEILVRKFKEENKKNKFELCFFYLMEGMFEPWAIEEIRSANIPICNFSCNNIHQFNLVEKISHLFTLNLYSEKAAKEKFDAINVNSLWWPMASNPKYFHPVKVEPAIDVSFVGGMYGSRLEYIYQILLAGIDLNVYGPGWSDYIGSKKKLFYSIRQFKNMSKSCIDEVLYFINAKQELIERKAESSYKIWLNNLGELAYKKFPHSFHTKISDVELVELYSKSKITLGFLEVFDNHKYTGRRLKHLHLRDFEAVLSGALYCTDYTDEMAEMFEPEKEVITCFDIHDRIDKIKYFLKNEEKGRMIRTAGLKRALSDHTYQKRFQQLFKFLGFTK